MENNVSKGLCEKFGNSEGDGGGGDIFWDQFWKGGVIGQIPSVGGMELHNKHNSLHLASKTCMDTMYMSLDIICSLYVPVHSFPQALLLESYSLLKIR